MQEEEVVANTHLRHLCASFSLYDISVIIEFKVLKQCFVENNELFINKLFFK